MRNQVAAKWLLNCHMLFEQIYEDEGRPFVLVIIILIWHDFQVMYIIIEVD